MLNVRQRVHLLNPHWGGEHSIARQERGAPAWGGRPLIVPRLRLGSASHSASLRTGDASRWTMVSDVDPRIRALCKEAAVALDMRVPAAQWTSRHDHRVGGLTTRCWITPEAAVRAMPVRLLLLCLLLRSSG